MKILIVYYSTYGNVYKMANMVVADGVGEVEGAEAVVRTVPELIPAEVIQTRADMKAGRELQRACPWPRWTTSARPGPSPSARRRRSATFPRQLRTRVDQL